MTKSTKASTQICLDDFDGMSRKDQQRQPHTKNRSHRMKLFSLKCLIIALVATTATFAFIQFASSSQRETTDNPKNHCQQAKDSILNWKLQHVESSELDDDVPAQQNSAKSHPRNLRIKFAVVRELAYTILLKRCKIFEPSDNGGRRKATDTGSDEQSGEAFEDMISQSVSLSSELANLVDKLDIQLPEKYVQFMEEFISGIRDPHIFEKIEL